MNTNLYCDFSLSYLAKKMGYDVPSTTFFTKRISDSRKTKVSTWDLITETNEVCYFNEDMDADFVRPTLEELHFWLIEKYNAYVTICPVCGSKNGYDSYPIIGWRFDALMLNRGFKNSYYMGYPIGDWFTATIDFPDDEIYHKDDIHPSYFTAFHAGLDQLLTFIEKETNKKS